MAINWTQTSPGLTDGPPPLVWETSGADEDRYPQPGPTFEGRPNVTGKFAGARVIQMIEHQVGAHDGAGGLPTVGDIYAFANSQNDINEPAGLWWIDPQGMFSALTAYDPRGPWNFAMYQHADQVQANSQIYETLTHFNVTAAVLVDALRHWICVKGWGLDNMNNLAGFWITDPAIDGGPKDQFPTMAGMWNTWFTPVSAMSGSQWSNQYVEVGDPHPVKEPVKIAPRIIKLPGDRIINAEEAVRLAEEGISEWKVPTPAFERLAAGAKALEPRLVSHMARGDTYYYIVPFVFENAAGKSLVNAGVILDARFGDILNVTASEEPFPMLAVSSHDARDRLLAAKVAVYDSLEISAERLLSELRHGEPSLRSEHQPPRRPIDIVTSALAAARLPRDSVTIRSESLYIHPVLGWMPCFGSPFNPVYIAITPLRIFYVSCLSGYVWSDIDLCDWIRLGG